MTAYPQRVGAAITSSTDRVWLVRGKALQPMGKQVMRRQVHHLRRPRVGTPAVPPRRRQHRPSLPVRLYLPLQEVQLPNVRQDR